MVTITEILEVCQYIRTEGKFTYVSFSNSYLFTDEIVVVVEEDDEDKNVNNRLHYARRFSSRDLKSIKLEQQHILDIFIQDARRNIDLRKQQREKEHGDPKTKRSSKVNRLGEP